MITENTICPVPSYQNKFSLPMRDLSSEYKQWLLKSRWLGWRFPEVKAYLENVLPGQPDGTFLHRINEAIPKLFYDRFISYPGEAEFIESLIRMTDSVRILELGMWNGFTTLHMIRGVWPYGHVTSIDAFDRRAWKIPDGLGTGEVHDPPRTREYLEKTGQDDLFHALEEETRLFKFICGWTPQAIDDLPDHPFDFVFVDSDHSEEHTKKELHSLMRVTRPGTLFVFHDVGDRVNLSPLGTQVRALNEAGVLRGWTYSTCKRMDSWHSMGLGIFVREQ